MEGKSENFDPEKHRMLEDEKSWASIDAVKLRWFPEELRSQYNQLVDSVISANPDLSPQQASDKIFELEKKYGREFFSIVRSNYGPNGQSVVERRRLSQLEELNLLTEEEKITLNDLRENFDKIVADIAEATGDDPEEIQKNIDSMFLNNIAKDLIEAKEMMVNGPIVEGFEETQDPRIPNITVREFMKDTFTLKGLTKAKVARVNKDDEYMFVDTNTNIDKMSELIKKGLLHWSDRGGHMIVNSKEEYLQAEMFLEEVDNPNELKHTFKLRAHAGDEIRLKSFGVEKSEDFDYLADIGLESEEDRMRAYILGVIAHEVAHQYEHQLENNFFDEYREIMTEEVAPEKRSKFVTDYVLKHSEVYNSGEQEIFQEDFAEAVRIYTTNPDYLIKNYPRRFAFIEQNFPFIKAGSVVEAVKNIEK
jgi:hypothetical protein